MVSEVARKTGRSLWIQYGLQQGVARKGGGVKRRTGGEGKCLFLTHVC